MTQINYTADQMQQINDLQAYVQQYCEANGIDPSIYTSALDGTSSIDPALLNDPVFQAYWKLAYLKLMEIINPTLVQSLYAETGEVDFEALQALAGDDLNAFIQDLVTDNPELMAFGALSDGDPSTTADAVFAALANAGAGGTESGSLEWVDEQARELAEELGLTGGMWDEMINTEEGIRTTENHLFNYLAEIDQQLADLAEALSSGDLTAEEFSAQTQAVSSTRQILVGMIQNLEEAWNNLLEMFSQLLKAQTDAEMGIAQRLNVPA